MNEFGTILGTFGLVLLGLLGLAVLGRRFAPQLRRRFQSVGRLQHLGLLSLSPQCSIALVRVGQETLVLGLTSQAVTLLTKAPDLDAQEAEQTEPAAKGQPGTTVAPLLNGGVIEAAL